MSGHALANVTGDHANGALDPIDSALDSIDQDWRFAELTAQCCLDPALAVRYAVEPRSVLAEFGIATDERTQIPALPAGLGCEVTITSLNPRDNVGCTTACSSWTFAPSVDPKVPTAAISPTQLGA